MYDWREFSSVFQSKPDYSLDQKQAETAARHRKELGGSLFFDRVWTSLGLKQAAKHYPPKSNQELRAAWQKIVQSSAPDHQKQALLYYILKDCRQLGNQADYTFTRRVHLPARYQLFMTGLWELDHCQFSRALDHLTNPSLIPTFADEVLLALLEHPKCDRSLAMAYALTVSPPLSNPNTLRAYFYLLCKINVMEAYNFCALRGEKHRELFEKLLYDVLSEPSSENRAQRTITLISMPFSAKEVAWFEEYLLNGTGSKCAEAKDTVMMRRIALGQTIEGIGSLDRLRGPKIGGVNWEDIRASLRKTTVT